MRRSWTIFALPVMAALVVGCLGGCRAPEIFDDLPDAALAESYDALLHSRYAREPVRYELFDGDLPAGLSLDSEGRLAGFPVGAGSYPFEVLLVDAGGDWTVGALNLEVTYTDDQVFVGPVLDTEELNGICLEGIEGPDDEPRFHMCMPWVRISGGGMPGQSERTLQAGLFWVGGNGTAEGGWFDDELLRTLPSDEIQWGFEAGEFVPQEASEGINSPLDTAVTEGGVLVAGELTGPGWIHVDHAEHGAYTIDALVVPPDFCPAPGGC